MKFKHTDLPIENEYPKLVRDRIPELIERERGVKVKRQVISDDNEFLLLLIRKLREELAELQFSLKAGNLEEELADIFEIIDAITKLKAIPVSDVKKIQKKKRRERGGFEERILMLGKYE